VGLNLPTDLEGMNSDYLINIQNQIEPYDVMNTANGLFELNEKYDFNYYIICGTTLGRMLAPRLAMNLTTGLVANVTEVKFNGDQLLLIRPTLSGNIMAAIRCQKSPVMMTIRPRAFSYENKKNKEALRIDYVSQAMVTSGLKSVRAHSKSHADDIFHSNVLVACGGGVANNLTAAKKLAALLGGQLAVSRKLVLLALLLECF